MSNSNTFDPARLVKHDESGLKELLNWVKGNGNSIKILWVPDEYTETEAKRDFKFIGTISGVVFAPNVERSGRNLRIYFSEWSTSAESYATRNSIASQWPTPHLLSSCNKNISYMMNITINLEPQRVN